MILSGFHHSTAFPLLFPPELCISSLHFFLHLRPSAGVHSLLNLCRVEPLNTVHLSQATSLSQLALLYKLFDSYHSFLTTALWHLISFLWITAERTVAYIHKTMVSYQGSVRDRRWKFCEWSHVARIPILVSSINHERSPLVRCAFGSLYSAPNEASLNVSEKCSGQEGCLMPRR